MEHDPEQRALDPIARVAAHRARRSSPFRPPDPGPATTVRWLRNDRVVELHLTDDDVARLAAGKPLSGQHPPPRVYDLADGRLRLASLISKMGARARQLDSATRRTPTR